MEQSTRNAQSQERGKVTERTDRYPEKEGEN
jgi:hypothetical protein